MNENFFVNTRNSTFENMIYLTDLAKKRFEEFGIKLQEEIMIIYSPS